MKTSSRPCGFSGAAARPNPPKSRRNSPGPSKTRPSGRSSRTWWSRSALTRKLRGKAYFYAARVPKAALLQSAIRRLAFVFAGGSRRELVAQLVEAGELSPEDLHLLRQTAAGNAPAKNRRKPT